MKRQMAAVAVLMLLSFASGTFAFEDTQQSVVYLVTYKTAQAADAEAVKVFVTYTIAAREDTTYWLQRTTAVNADAGPLSITQTLLDDRTHQALRYIMHRPANMDRPENVIDLPLSKMGKDEILPVPITAAFSEETDIQVAAGTYAAYKGEKDRITLWLNAEVPILGVVKAETPDWTMELFSLTDAVEDLLPQKPPKGGIVYLKNN